MNVEQEDSKSNQEQTYHTIQGHTYFQWLIALTANLSLVTYGLQFGWTSPMTIVLQSASSPTGYALSTTAISWIGSAMALAATLGVPIFSYLADAYGRKPAILVLLLPQALCWMIKLSSANTIIIIIARILAGLSAGGCFLVVPMYVKEISQDNIRGQLGSLLILCQYIGVTIMFILGMYLGYFTVLYSVIWLPFLTFLLLLKAPESPAYLIKIGKVNEAISAVAFLRGLDKDHELVIKEIEKIKNEDLYSKLQPNVRFFNIFKNSVWRRSFSIIIALMTLRAWNGSLSIITYASSVLGQSGNNVSPQLQSLSFPLISILAGFISIACIERFGRKPLLGTCFALIAVAMMCIGTVVLIKHFGGTVPYWIPLIAMIIAVAGFAAGPSPVPYIVLSELFNIQIRAKLMGCIVSFGWLMAFIQLFIFGPISAELGLYTAFYLYAGINIVAVFLSLVVLPETKGKSVQEIEEILKKKYKLKD